MNSPMAVSSKEELGSVRTAVVDGAPSFKRPVAFTGGSDQAHHALAG